MPLRAVVTPRNRYDSPFLPNLIEDLETDYVLADAGYDSKTKQSKAKQSAQSKAKQSKAIDAEPVIASNPRRGNARKSSIRFF